MAITGPGLSSAIQAAIAGIDPSDLTHNPFVTMWDTVAAAIVNYLKANTQVVVTSVTGVTVGAGVSGPGTGTIT